MTLSSRRYFFFACIIVALCTTAAAYPTAKFNSEQVFPAASWQKVKSLRAAGWSEDKLDIARPYAESIHSSAVMVIQGSEVIAEWGNVEQKINSYSMRKSLISGIYQAGAETFLVERLYEYLMSFVEVQSGDVRILFPVGENEFVAGPTFLAAQPTEWQITFAMNSAGDATSLQAVQGGKRREARQFVLHREDVIFHNGDVTLAGALISPAGRGPHPALVFTHGSGPATRQSYFGLGFLLASQGIAALMYDKRGSGDSTGNLTRFTYTDLADDAVAGARFLQSRREIDPARIGFWGISEGAWTAPLAASRLPGTAFVIAASGGGLSPAEGELLDSEDQLHTDGRFSDVDIAEALAFQRARDRYMRTKEGWEEYAAAQKKAVERPWYGYPTTDLFGPERPDDPEWHNKALYYFYDPSPALRRLRCPFLGIAGALDTPAATERSMAAMRSALTSGGDKYFTLRVLSQANHDSFEATTGNTEKLNGVKVFSPEFFPLITDWVRKAALDKK